MVQDARLWSFQLLAQVKTMVRSCAAGLYQGKTNDRIFHQG